MKNRPRSPQVEICG
uniref:Uncharacterized protein n=1 Tax=Anguilla anguilla TaxID=7936 RepID=A0A0E9R2T3_ANGAN